MARTLPNSVFIAPFNFRNIGRQELPQYIKLGPSQGREDFSKKSGGAYFSSFIAFLLRNLKKFPKFRGEAISSQALRGGYSPPPN